MPNLIAERVVMLVKGARACDYAADTGVNPIAADMSADDYRALSLKLWDRAFCLAFDQPITPIEIVEG